MRGASEGMGKKNRAVHSAGQRHREREVGADNGEEIVLCQRGKIKAHPDTKPLTFCNFTPLFKNGNAMHACATG